MHGVSVIDFQQSGSVGIYATLGEAFGIPWHVIVDGDQESAKFRQQILDRGFREAELADRFVTLPQPNNLEGQLIADGHLPLLRQIVSESIGDQALHCTADEFRARLGNRKTCYMGGLCDRIASDAALAGQMPAAFVNLITNLRDNAV
jgi:putative ATP-dependent endonuclease of OLD family